MNSMKYPPIEDHGIIGDLHTVALVGIDGTIDFMCFPNFDSPSIFARLLDYERGGYFQLSPILDDANRKQLYLPNTNVLLSRFLSDGGVAEISDFMPVEAVSPAHNLVRRAKTVRGDIPYRMVCKPAFDYGRADHSVEVQDGVVLFHSKGSDGLALRLRSEVPVEIQDGAAVAEFSLTHGETAAFILESAEDCLPDETSGADYVSSSFRETVNYWHDWIGQSNYEGRWREMVNRSALTLKLLTSWEYGSIVASPTFGLPEVIGGVRNWDYRYTWIRDASFTLYGLIRLGYTDEAHDFMQWLVQRCNEIGPGDDLQIMYGLAGQKNLDEHTLDHLEGYRGSIPVRIGNDAYRQLQLDIYGELMDSVYLYDKYGEPISYDLWQNLTNLLQWLEDHWDQPDEGIWEVRGGEHPFLFSRLMSWVAFDRGIRLARKRGFPGPINQWMAIRDTIYKDIFNNFWDPAHKYFVQYKGSNALDASSLLMPLVRFISPTDPYWLSHLKAIEEHLIYDSLVYRYDAELAAPNGLVGEEGTFSMCTFWYVECLSRSGDVKKARFYFEKMLGYANHLGLYAEELGPKAEHLGNFPQAFTHLALISAAYDINRRLPL